MANINGTPGNDTLVGDGDTIAASFYGFGGDDSITGGVSGDVLAGGNGNDTLTGGADNDSLTGGTGRDDFVFAAAAGNGTDNISDFVRAVDRLVFTGSDYGFGSGHTLTAAQFTAGTTASGTGAQSSGMPQVAASSGTPMAQARARPSTWR